MSMQGTASVDATGTCNYNLPNSSVYARFIYLIRFLTRNGFYVIVDNHLNVDTLAQDNPSEGGSTRTFQLISLPAWQRYACQPLTAAV